MKHPRPFLLALLLGFLPACATPEPPPVTQQDLTKIDYGSPPQDYEQVVKDYFTKTLREPESTQFRFGLPFKGYLQHGALLGGQVAEAGYFVEVWLKLKSPTGEYLPERRLAVLIKNGEVLIRLREAEINGIKRSP